MKLTGNTIVITGGSSGIGLELAKVLIEKKNKVIICGRSQEKLDQAKELFPSLQIFQCDLSIQTERERFSDWVVGNHPDCNILINNAAIVHKTSFFADENIIEKAEKEIQTNFMAPLALTKLFMPLVQKNRLKVIFVTTGLVYAPKAAYPVYCATKAGLHSFIHTLRLQLNHEPLDIYEVLMPAVDTPFHQGKVPAMAISCEKAVDEMLIKLEKGQKEIKIGGVKILSIISRIVPSLAVKLVNNDKYK
jgi:uncharacterized oxidoreductase